MHLNVYSKIIDTNKYCVFFYWNIKTTTIILSFDVDGVVIGLSGKHKYDFKLRMHIFSIAELSAQALSPAHYSFFIVSISGVHVSRN